MNENNLPQKLFGVLSTSLLLYSQRFGRCALRLSSGASCRTRELSFRTQVPYFRIWEPSCRKRESSRNFTLNPLFNPRG